MIDTHCHLTLCKHLSIEEHINQATQDGIKKILDPGLSINDLIPRYEKLKNYSQVLLGMAVAPHDRNHILSDQEQQHLEEMISTMENLLNDYPIVALSEIGLDYFHNVYNRDFQKQLLLSQLRLAKQYSLPVFLHIRDAYHDAFEVLKESGHQKGAVHCFTGNKEDAKKFIDWGFHLSFSGIVTFKKSDELRDIAKWMPIERILTETDSPYLAPVPYRGKPNQANYLIHINQCLAEVKNIQTDSFHQQLWSNAEELLEFSN